VKDSKIQKLEVRLSELEVKLNEALDHPPVNNMGKWSRSVKLDRLREDIIKVEGMIEKLKQTK